MRQLLRLFVEIFTKDLKNSYLTSVVEQEINNTILMSQELARRCVWLRTANPSDTEDASDVLVEENARRLNNLVAELKVRGICFWEGIISNRSLSLAFRQSV